MKEDTYILLKDLPGYKAGEKFNVYYIDGDELYWYKSEGNNAVFKHTAVENNPEWFAKEVERKVTVIFWSAVTNENTPNITFNLNNGFTITIPKERLAEILLTEDCSGWNDKRFTKDDLIDYSNFMIEKCVVKSKPFSHTPVFDEWMKTRKP